MTTPGASRPRAAAIFLLLLGLLQMAGDVLRIPALRGIGAATAASPAPKVFSAVRGLETYSTTFFLVRKEASGARAERRITSRHYAQLRGPYNRRNVFGAVLAYGPVLASDPRTRPLFDAISRYALCGEAPLLRELGLPVGEVPGAVYLRLEPRPGTHAENLPLELAPPCSATPVTLPEPRR